ncbi:hypothetical protein SNEBB_006327 [Seison nebaliae]|nr:hypothetical protein SNEBB_006327 [Seison nebaliae]
MDFELINTFGALLMKLKIFPYFELAHYIIKCSAVRDDIEKTAPGGVQNFSRRHPFSTWISCILICHAGSFLAAFMLGESLMTVFNNHEKLLYTSIIWYFIFFFPFDITWKICRCTPIYLLIGIMDEMFRCRLVYTYVLKSLDIYPRAWISAILIGTAKAAGGSVMKIADRFVRGIWLPQSNEFLTPTFSSKAYLLGSCAFVAYEMNVLPPNYSIHFVYFCVTLFFIYVKGTSILFKQHDPLLPLENMVSAIAFGGINDAFVRAWERQRKTQSTTRNGLNVESSLPNKLDQTVRSSTPQSTAQQQQQQQQLQQQSSINQSQVAAVNQILFFKIKTK